MSEPNVLKGTSIFSNILIFIAMVAVCGALLECLLYIMEKFDMGIGRLAFPFAAVALYGACGYFAFTGNSSLRATLIFFSVIACGALGVLFYDPGKTFYPLLTSVPFAAIAGAAAAISGQYFARRQPSSANENLG